MLKFRQPECHSSIVIMIGLLIVNRASCHCEKRYKIVKLVRGTTTQVVLWSFTSMVLREILRK